MYVTVSVPVRVPTAVGVKETLIGQGLFVTKVSSLSQVSCSWKSPEGKPSTCPLTVIRGTLVPPPLAGLMSVIV
jgi:hypothetical protein